MGSKTASGIAGPRGVAIIGMSGRFPGARDLADFWDNLAGGVESISFFSDEELRAAGVTAQALRDPQYVKAAPVLDGVDLFDAAFFECSPREARLIDPQHRLFLECAWESLENAGYDPLHTAVPVGVYGGAGGLVSSYLLCHAREHGALVGPTGSLSHISNDKDFLTTRVSYKLNLRGPSVNVQSACSTSLVAVHIACQSLLSHECDMALAGGVSVRVPQTAGYLHEVGGIISPDGHCRAFDAAAQGTIFGSGVGIVVLKRLADALADGDPIRAIIQGSAINNDGGDKLSYTAASEAGQADAIAEALALADFDPDTVTLIEAHGTATALGDPVEISALSKVFRSRTRQTRYCAVGSVKTNIGHPEAAAGVAGLIKAVLALEHRQVPASLHFERPNPRIDFERSPFFVNAQTRDWHSENGPRRAGVNSLGFGGTNAFVALEEAPRRPSQADRPGSAELFCLSAKSENALAQMAQRYLQHFDRFGDLSLREICHTTQFGRTPFAERLAVVANSLAELRQKLADCAAGRPVQGAFRGRAGAARRVVADSPAQLALPANEQDPCSEALEKLGQHWVKGIDCDWSVRPGNDRPHRTALPTYPFQRERYWIATEIDAETSTAEAPPAPPKTAFPGRRVPSPLTEIQFECELGVPVWPQLAEHRIYGQVIVPGAWHLAHVLAGVRQTCGTAEVTLSEVLFPRALGLADDEIRTVQLVLTPLETGSAFQVWSRAANQVWQLHAQGKYAVVEESNRTVEPATRPDWEQSGWQKLERAEFYQRMRDREIDLGLSFQWNSQVACRANEIMVRVSRPVPDVDGFVLHPGLIDACLQALIARLSTTYLPLSIESCRFSPTGRQPAWMQARSRQVECPEPELLLGDIRLFDETGQPILEMLGVGLKRASRSLVRMGAQTAAATRPVAEAEGFQLQIPSRGVFEDLRVQPVPRRPPATGEVEIRVRAAGLNFRDVLNALGKYPGDPGALGLECAGVITAVGPDVPDLQVGLDVLGIACGSFAKFVSTPALLVRRKPEDLTFEDAAAIPVAFLSAHYALNRLAGISAGQRVLIHAASGGVGLAAVQLARAAGAEVFATAGSPEKRAYLQQLGIAQPMNSRTDEFAREVLDRTGGRGVDVVLNSLSGDLIRAGISVLRPGGYFIELGKIGIWDAERVAAYRPDISYATMALDAMLHNQPEVIGCMLGEVLAEFAAGRLRSLPVRVFPLAEAESAFRFLAQAKHIGKLVLSLPTTPADGRLATQPFTAAHESARPAELAASPAQPILRADLQQQVQDHLARVLGLDSAQGLDDQRSLKDLGLDSLGAVELINALAKSTGCPLPSDLIFNRPTIAALTDYLVENKRGPSPSVAPAPPAKDRLSPLASAAETTTVNRADRWVKHLAEEAVRWAERKLPVNLLILLVLPAAAVRAAYQWVSLNYFSTVSRGRRALLATIEDSRPRRYSLGQTWRGHVCLCMARLFRLWPDRLREPRWTKRCTFFGKDRLEAALATNRPVLLATVHYGKLLELRNWLRANGYAIAFLESTDLTRDTSYRDHLETLADKATGLENVPRRFRPDQTGEASDFLNGRRRLLGVAMDAGHPGSILARGEVFGVRFVPGGLRLAAMTNAVVIPCIIRATWCMRNEIYFGEPVPDELVTSRNQHVQALEHVLREVSPWIVSNPEQCAPHLIAAIELESHTIRQDGL